MIIPLSKADNPQWRLAVSADLEKFLLGFRRTGKDAPTGVAEVTITPTDDVAPEDDAGVPIAHPSVLTRESTGVGAIWLRASPGSPIDGFEIVVKTPSATSYVAQMLAGETDLWVAPGGARNPAVAVYPGEGGTCLVEYSISPLADVRAGTARWIEWPHGAASALTGDALLAPVTALRCTAADAAGQWEILA